jgi:hypothetical protein
MFHSSVTRATPFKGGGEYWVEIAAREIESLGMIGELLLDFLK